ncbi:hypothetical protein C8J28_12314 [Cereibacter azotoformans]|uniref:Uncharacterized protein n=1 Tax=Cereibacter azotoformans TaxID=43057 RepID=A0A2T5JT11_9RHOB|nr:hypothetical protein C8J28_12314 [Cereibacter azotoformans]
MHSAQTHFGTAATKSVSADPARAATLGKAQVRVLSATRPCPVGLAVFLLAYAAVVGIILAPSGSLSSAGATVGQIR